MRYFDILFKVIYESFYKDLDDGDIYTTAIIFLLIILNLTSIAFLVQSFAGEIIKDYVLLYTIISILLIIILYRRYIYSNNFSKIQSRHYKNNKRELYFTIIYIALSIIALVITYNLNYIFVNEL